MTLWERFCYWFDDIWPELVFWGFMLLLLVGIIMVGMTVVQSDREAREVFMKECLTERKQYECTAMWRHESQVIPVPIIIPSGR